MGKEGGCVLNRKWQRKRQEVIARAGGMCERCGEQPGQHVHHFIYAQRLGTEPIEWLQYVCLDCHGRYHPRYNFKPIVPRKKRSPIISSRADCEHCRGSYSPNRHRQMCVKNGLHRSICRKAKRRPRAIRRAIDRPKIIQKKKARHWESIFDWVPRP